MLTIDPGPFSEERFSAAASVADPPLREVLADIASTVPPLWPLSDFVAVNPFVGLTQHPFLDARRLLKDVRRCDLLPPVRYFRSLLESGELEPADVLVASDRCAQEYPDLYAGWDGETVVQRVLEAEQADESAERRFFTVSEAVDRLTGSSWTDHLINDITRHCAAHYDEGQATWTNPWRDASLYDAWRDAAQRSWRMDMLGVAGFRKLVTALPEAPVDAVAQLLEILEIPARHWRSFLLCELFSVTGWASYIKYRVGEAEAADHPDNDLVGLLAIRLAYDAAILQCQGFPPLELYPSEDAAADAGRSEGDAVPDEIRVCYALQVAAETAYARKLRGVLDSRLRLGRPIRGKSLQMVFCIDVRSECIRRHLEAVDDSIETFGFAGFFGMPLEYIRLGESSGYSQCPVLLRPSFRIQEHVLDHTEAEDQVIRVRWAQRATRKMWKLFQTSAASCFSFVESLGLWYSIRLLANSFHASRPVEVADRDGLPRNRPAVLGPLVDKNALSLQRRSDLAEGMLRNLGLTDGFGRIVALCGHTADVVNNPYQASLACGACGGHSGEPNARVAAAILNDPQVRDELRRRGIGIPADTWFVPSVHNTTTDEICFLDLHAVPDTHQNLFAQVRHWIQEASQRSRAERLRRLGTTRCDDVFRRSRDWAEVRPEWGLARNAAFIVAPRSRTEGLDLGGRTFLHSYDHRRDPGSKVLELIMTAPMIVANWINLQYYASTVDNRAFGSGNKLIHNVVGQFGILQGNGGDLQTGLPWQSVHDGIRFQHEPLRLLVVIEASRDAVARIIRKHATVRDLARHGWLTLEVLDGEQWYRWTCNEGWQMEPAPYETQDIPSRQCVPLQGP